MQSISVGAVKIFRTNPKDLFSVFILRLGKNMGRTALISVSDKRNLDFLARELKRLNFDIISTGGTAKYLENLGIEVEQVSDLTGFPEILEGRVKTLHPKIHAGILARREKKEDMDTLEKYSIKPIDLVVCNLYPFEEVIKKDNPSMEEVIENIDIGGPTLIRAAAKNYRDVLVVINPDRYQELVEKLKSDVSEEFRKKLAIEAFEHVARYDAVIANYLRKRLSGEKFPGNLTLTFKLIQKTRYGENPHQDGAFYKIIPEIREGCLTNSRKLHGKELSYNNILDADAAIECLKEFDEPTAVIIKHATPCGIASSDNIYDAWIKAYETDTYSPFGGVVAFNREINNKLAEELSKYFLEVVIAPSYSREALEILKRKKNLRILEIPSIEGREEAMCIRSVTGGILLQDRDMKKIDPKEWKVVTKKKPTDDDIRSMVFAVKCVKHVKSNGVVFVKGTQTVAIGGGQTARVDAVWIATHKGKERIRGSIMASDAFFPFRDAIDLAAKFGVRAIVQPGGSIRDKEVIDAADEHGIIMVFTGQRYFRH